MRKAFIISSFLSIFFLQAFTAGDEDIVSFKDLSFNSYFEEMAFYNYCNGQEDILMLMTAIDPDVNTNIYEGFKNDLDRELNKINSRKFQRVREEKKVNIIYQYVNSQVLTQYRDKILFPHIFVNGTFNCLTASAYYGLLMDSLDIDYDIRETYDHVHPVAFPNSLQIKIETTDPVAGVEYYDEKLKRKFVDYLFEKKMINRDEYYSSSIGDIFNRYFLPESSIGLSELVGLHYMNDALYKFDADNYSSAFEQIKKAYFLYPARRMRMLFQFILTGAMSNADFNEIEEAAYFVYLSRLPDENINPEELSISFLYLTQRILFNSPRSAYYDSLFSYLDKNMEEGVAKNAISFQYYFLRGKSKLIHYKFREAVDLFEKAYEINPYNLELQSLIISTLDVTFENTPVALLIEQVEDYAENMPVLSENGMFISLQMMAYLVFTEQLFDFEEEDKAITYLEKFEDLYVKNPGVEIDYEQLGEAYSAAAVFYFKNYQKSRAIEFLERGLRIAPQNYELRYRLNSVKNP
ncbi:MAG: tetratricopeptide repeat protein [Bacteroidota bacterium]